MPIRPHGKGYEVRVQHGGSRPSKTVRNRTDALQLERIWQQRIVDRELGRTPRYSLEEAIERWLTGEARALKSYGNLKDKVRVMYPFVAGKALTEVVEAAEQVKRAGMTKGLQPGTINRRLAVLRRVANLAYRQWEPPWLDRDLGTRIKLLPGEEPRYVKANAEQAQKLIQAAEKRVGAAIEYLALAGLRPSELLAIEPESFQDGGILVTQTKTGRTRLVPLPAGLKKDRFPFGLTKSELRKGFERARAAAGMTWLQMRDLRRTFGSWIVQRTGSLKAAQELLGHSTVAITSRHYAHLLPGHLQEAVNTLPRLRAGKARGRGKVA